MCPWKKLNYFKSAEFSCETDEVDLDAVQNYYAFMEAI